MKKEQPYEFRKKLLTVHEENIHDFSLMPDKNQVAISDGVIIEIGDTDNIVIKTAAEDFADFLKTSMSVNALVSKSAEPKKGNVISLALAKDKGISLDEAEGYKGFLIDVDENIKIYGNDDRGIAAALYYIEDLMTFNRAPFLDKGIIKKKPLMAPSMVHSGYGLEEWPDEYLMRIAHEGRDALLVFVRGSNQTRVGELDFNDLIERAAKYGIDVYAYSFIRGGKHPDEPDAEEFYDNLYGDLFRKHPGFKGVTLVGEVVEFNSKDPHVSKFCSYQKSDLDIPDPKFWPGWYPCEDMPKWVKLVNKVIKKVKPDADVVLWSYNWGFQPEEERIRLIENLPDDITLQATFEMFDNKKIGDVYTSCDDYSLAFAGPGPYFTSEAKAAKKKGLKLYAMHQAAGITWDFGTVSFLPMPYQWARRFENMRKANHEWGLCGGMDCHHHGFYPSIITKLSKHAFLTPKESMEDILDKIFIAEYGENNLEKVREAFKLWSEAITYFTPTNGDQCGPSRIGPAYPFYLFHTVKIPYDESAMFGAAVVGTDYTSDILHPSFTMKNPASTALSIRIYPEINSLEKMHSLMLEGIEIFESIKDKNEKLESIINLGKYIANCTLTNIHFKKWYLLKSNMKVAFERDKLREVVSDMETLLKSEIENAKATIPLVEVDSRLGWEPSMLYLGDKEHIEWKIRQVNYVLEKEIVYLKKSIEI